jgi:hypothetical protein
MSHTANVNQPTKSYHAPPKRQQREPVLVVLHADGWVEVFAERHVDARIAVMPFMASAEGQIAADQNLEADLPYPFRTLYWPSRRRAADMVRTVRPSDIARRDWNIEFLRSLEQAGRILRGDDEMEGQQIWIA